MACRQLGQLHAPGVQEGRLSYEDGVRSIALDSGKSRINFAAGAGVENLNLQSNSPGSRLYGSQCGLGIRHVGGIDQHGNALGPRHQLTQKLQSFRGQFGIEKINACQVSARTRETCDQTKSDWVFASEKENRNSRCCRFSRQCGIASSACDDRRRRQNARSAAQLRQSVPSISCCFGIRSLRSRLRRSRFLSDPDEVRAGDLQLPQVIGDRETRSQELAVAAHAL